jgi:hypothetical protein
LDVFVRGNNNNLYHQWFSGGAWNGSWENLGGGLNSAPDACAWGTNRIDVAVLGGGNGNLYHKYYTGNGVWSGFVNAGGSSSSDPGICTTGMNSLSVFTRAGADNLYWANYNGTSWSAFSSLGGGLYPEFP